MGPVLSEGDGSIWSPLGRVCKDEAGLRKGLV